MNAEGKGVENTQGGATKPRVTLVCTGKAKVGKNEIGLVFRIVNPDGSLGAESIYGRKGLQSVHVGAVYDVDTGSNPTSIFVNSMRWRSLWADAGEVAVWQTAADAFDTLELAIRQERKQNGRRLPVERLEPIRRQYWSTNAAGRLAIEVRVLAYLRQVSLA